MAVAALGGVDRRQLESFDVRPIDERDLLPPRLGRECREVLLERYLDAHAPALDRQRKLPPRFRHALYRHGSANQLAVEPARNQLHVLPCFRYERPYQPVL